MTTEFVAGADRGAGSLPWPPNVEECEIERKREIRGLIILCLTLKDPSTRVYIGSSPPKLMEITIKYYPS